ncbi:MAG: homoserine kinase [Clostridia bacterium]|nr:homoserine kinase [Clostridia bacterium]
MKSVTVRVPATSANIGPGFDSLGIALSLYNTFTFAQTEKTSVAGCEEKYANENNLALVAFRAACEKAGKSAPAVSLDIRAEVPVSRGLGSSATLLVAGAVGANALLDLGLSDGDLFEVVNRLEGHPDNVAPALFGGFTASLLDNGVPYTMALSVHPKYRFCAFVPDFETSTHEARAVLPMPCITVLTLRF